MFTFLPQFVSPWSTIANVTEPDTVDTTRINYGDIYNFNVAVAKLIYPSKDINWRPHAVILVPSDIWQYGLCAASLVHFPINAPIMFTERLYLPQVILTEILRLSPTGLGVPAKVLLAGPISSNVENQLINAGLTTYRVTSSRDVYQFCVDIANFRLYKIPPSSEIGFQDIIVVSGEDYTEGIPATFYAAHMGTLILIVSKDSIPRVVEYFIVNNQHKNYYILGSTKTISQNVESLLKSIIAGHVERIDGSDPYSISVNFAKYSSPVDNFGWKYTKKVGYAFTYGELQKWQHIISSVLLAHLGKHTPLLIVNKMFLPDIVKNYVVSVNPEKTTSHEPPYMQGYILGDYTDISHNVQVEIEKITNIMSSEAH